MIFLANRKSTEKEFQFCPRVTNLEKFFTLLAKIKIVKEVNKNTECT